MIWLVASFTNFPISWTLASKMRRCTEVTVLYAISGACTLLALQLLTSALTSLAAGAAAACMVLSLGVTTTPSPHCINWGITLRASLSGTFLQTLPDLITPLKGHSLSPRSCPATQSAPSEMFGYWYDCRSNLAPKHARKHETHPPRVKKRKRVPSRLKRLWFYLCWCKLCWRL